MVYIKSPIFFQVLGFRIFRILFFLHIVFAIFFFTSSFSSVFLICFFRFSSPPGRANVPQTLYIAAKTHVFHIRKSLLFPLPFDGPESTPDLEKPHFWLLLLSLGFHFLSGKTSYFAAIYSVCARSDFFAFLCFKRFCKSVFL